MECYIKDKDLDELQEKLKTEIEILTNIHKEIENKELNYFDNLDYTTKIKNKIENLEKCKEIFIDFIFYKMIEISLQDYNVIQYEATYYIDDDLYKKIDYIHDSIYEVMENENYTSAERKDKLIDIINKMIDALTSYNDEIDAIYDEFIRMVIYRSQQQR